ncbi:unknown [Dialister sp. CAG:357]|nr:unknown [Dialister sp. CAG:357]
MAEIGVAITHIPTKEGMVIRLAKRIAVSVLLSTMSPRFCAIASETKGTRLAARDAVTMVGMLTRAVAMPVR